MPQKLSTKHGGSHLLQNVFLEVQIFYKMVLCFLSKKLKNSENTTS